MSDALAGIGERGIQEPAAAAAAATAACRCTAAVSRSGGVPFTLAVGLWLAVQVVGGASGREGGRQREVLVRVHWRKSSRGRVPPASGEERGEHAARHDGKGQPQARGSEDDVSSDLIRVQADEARVGGEGGDPESIPEALAGSRFASTNACHDDRSRTPSASVAVRSSRRLEAKAAAASASLELKTTKT